MKPGIQDLNSIQQSHQKMSVEQFADELARSLERRGPAAETDVYESL